MDNLASVCCKCVMKEASDLIIKSLKYLKINCNILSY